MQIKSFLTLVVVAILSSCGGGGGGDGETPSAPQIPDAQASDWTVPTEFVRDGGPGRDGIPALNSPDFIAADTVTFMGPSDLIVVVERNGQVKGYPHKILDWHEVVNDQLGGERFVLSYCPLTGSAIGWPLDDNTGDSLFGVSGLLYNSNLIMFDRQTDSFWPQMLLESARGPKVGTKVNTIATFEISWDTFIATYPQGNVLSDDTGFSRDYQEYPYGTYRETVNVLFPVDNFEDQRLFRKQRVLGIQVDGQAKAYDISRFAPDLEIINDSLSGIDLVIIGSADGQFANAYLRPDTMDADDNFLPVFNQFPIVMSDNRGNLWDINGVAVSGPNAGQQLQTTFSYVSYWFAWTGFFPQTTLHFQ